MRKNVLYCGDNLEVMRDMPSDSIDLICMDPPFNTNRDWGKFNDKWEKGLKGYLKFMEPRLEECHRLLKSTGSLYLHCDQKASHYLKVMLDVIFGIENFRNEIIWHRRWQCNNTKSKFPKSHDTILFYAKSSCSYFKPIYEDVSKMSKRSLEEYRYKDKNNRKYRRCRDRRGKLKITYFDMLKGLMVNSVWIRSKEFPGLSSASKERLGYPTQKPVALYKRMVEASSKEGDIVLDPFCGSGTTLEAAQKLGRNWIGIDDSPDAISLCEERLGSVQQSLF